MHPYERKGGPVWGAEVADEAGTMMASWLLPMLLGLGCMIALVGELSLPVWPGIMMALGLPVVLFARLLHAGQWTPRDLRWAWVPAVIMVTSYVDPSWTGPMLWDQSDHLQTANRYLGRWEWEPFHMDQDFSFRPKVISGLAAAEFAMTGASTHVHAVPWIVLVACGWQVQRLSEEAGAGRWSLLAPLIVLTFPAMMQQGRTVYLEALATGGLMLALRIGMHVLDAPPKQSVGGLHGGVLATVGLAKFPYLYLGPALALLLGWRTKSLARGAWVVLGWTVVVAPFFLSDWVDHGQFAASIDPQVTGAVASLTGEVGTYGPSQAITEMLFEMGLVMHLLCATGLVLWVMGDAAPRALTVVGLLLPGLILFAFVLDFGWPRYHLPWLAGLVCFGLAGLVHAPPAHRVLEHAAWRPVVLSLLMVCSGIHLNTVLGETLDERDATAKKMEWRWNLFDHYTALGPFIPEDAVVLAGYDISLGLRYETETYRFGPSDDPIHDSIVVVDATHVVTGGIATRFAWEDEPMRLLGAPMSPVTHITQGGDHHILWTVDAQRLAWHDAADALNLTEARVHSGDAVLVDGGATVEAPDGWTWSEAFDAGKQEADASGVVDFMLGLDGTASRVCSASCPDEITVPEGTTYLLRVRWSDA